MNFEIKQRIERIKNGEVPEGYFRTKIGVFPDDWEVVSFDEKFNRLDRKNDEDNQNVLTISAQQGLISQEDYYTSSYASENKKGYSLLYKGDFSYNKSYSGDYLYGAIKRLDKYEKGIVSPLYICFEPKDGTNSEFYLQYFEAGLFNGEIYKIAQEGARNHGLLNVSITDFFKTRLVNPPSKEQQKIAEILMQCDKVIELKQKRIEEEKKLKKALMQKLLNPDSGISLPGFKGEWSLLKLGDCVSIIRGGSPRPIEKYLTNYKDSVNWIKIGDTHEEEKYIVQVAERITKEGASTARYVFKGEFWLSNSMSYGRPYILKDDGCIHDGWLALRNYNTIFNIDFLYYMLSSQFVLYQYEMFAAGSGVHNLNIDLVANTRVYAPTIEEQIEIAEILSTQDVKIRTLLIELEQWQHKKKSLMQLLLTGIMRVQA